MGPEGRCGAGLRSLRHRGFLRRLLRLALWLRQDAGAENEARPCDREAPVQRPDRLRDAAGEDGWHHPAVDGLPHLLPAYRPQRDDHLDRAGQGETTLELIGHLSALAGMVIPIELCVPVPHVCAHMCARTCMLVAWGL